MDQLGPGYSHVTNHIKLVNCDLLLFVSKANNISLQYDDPLAMPRLYLLYLKYAKLNRDWKVNPKGMN